MLADLRIHPGELDAWLSRGEQPVGWIHVNVVASATDVRVHDPRQHGVQLAQQADVSGYIEIFPNRLEVPQCCIDRVVLRIYYRAREIIWQHSLTDETRERSDDISSEPRTSGGQAKAWKRNHGVATPVAKPGIPGQHRSRFCGAILRACHNKLVGSEDELLDGRRGGWSNPHIP